MENASKALLMAAGVLIGVLILSLAAFLFLDFGATSKGIYSQVEETQLTQYNAQYTIYSGRKDITIYDIVSVANLAKENNEFYKDYTNSDNIYKVKVYVKFLSSDGGNYPEFQNATAKIMQEKINKYNEVYSSNGELKYKFECKAENITYHSNGRIKNIKFTIIT